MSPPSQHESLCLVELVSPVPKTIWGSQEEIGSRAAPSCPLSVPKPKDVKPGVAWGTYAAACSPRAGQDLPSRARVLPLAAGATPGRKRAKKSMCAALGPLWFGVYLDRLS